MANGLGYFDLLSFDGTISANVSFYCVPYEAIGRARQAYLNGNTDLTCLVPPYSTVMNVYYYPYLYSKLDAGDTISYEGSDVYFERINVNPSKSYFTDTEWSGYAYRIIPANTSTTPAVLHTYLHTLAKFKGMPTKPSSVGGNFNWRNESKLYTYPFRYLEIRDGFSTPIDVIPQNLPIINLNNDYHELRCHNTINAQGQYALYIHRYNSSDYAIENFNINTVTLPNMTNTYIDYLYRNTDSLKQAKTNMKWDTFMGVVNTASSGISTGLQATAVLANPALGTALGVIEGAATALNQGYNIYKNWQGAIDTETDMARQPNVISGIYSDYALGFQHDKFLRILEHTYYDDNMKRLAYVFHRTGYASNRLEVPNINSRKYWNFLKCSMCNIKVDGIPKEHILKLKSIFESGTTVWHISNGADVGDYSKDNPEVY